VRRRVVEGAEAVAARSLARMLPEEFELADRQELDDAVLELMGIADAEERWQLRERIYAALKEMYGATREREQVAQRDRARAARRGRNTAAEMAEDIWLAERDRVRLLEFPADFVRQWAKASVFDLPDGEVEVGEAMMTTGRHLRAGTMRVGGRTGTEHDVGGIGRARFLAAAAECGYYGPLKVPTEEEAEIAAQEFGRYRQDLRRQFRQFAAQRTRDERKQRAIVEALLRMALRWRKQDAT